MAKVRPTNASKLSMKELLGQGYNKFFKTESGKIILTGGKGSKKSKSTALKLMYMLKKYPLACLLVTRAVKDTIKDSAYNDLKWACQKLHLESEWKFTKSPLQAVNKVTGQIIFFKGLDDWGKLASLDTGSPDLRLCWWWCEEAYEVEDEDALRKIDLSIRGTLPEGYHKMIIYTFNPWDSEHCLVKELLEHLKPDEDVLRKEGKQETEAIVEEIVDDVDENGVPIKVKINTHYLYMITNYKLNEWLSLEDKAKYNEMERTNPYKYLTEGLGIPSAPIGNIFREEWFHNRYEDAPTNLAFKLLSVDATFKKESVNKNGETDYVALQVWGKSYDNKFYLTHRRKARLSFLETIQQIEELIKLVPDLNAILIEDKANGSAIIEVLRQKYPYVIAVQPKGGKESRAQAIAPCFECGNVYLPDRPWLSGYINEFVGFPNALHDDEVDATSQALMRLMNIATYSYTEEETQQREKEDREYKEIRDSLGLMENYDSTLDLYNGGYDKFFFNY